jgi:predicted PurR-regulated permease PerM
MWYNKHMNNENKPSKVVIDISLRSIFRVLFVVTLVYLFFKLTNVVLILVTSIIIASFIEHVVLKFRKRKIPRPVTVVLVYLMGLIFIALFSFYVIPVFVKEVSSLVDFLSTIFKKTEFFNNLPFDTFENTKNFFSQISTDSTSTEIIRSTQVFLGKLSSGIGSTISGVFGSVLNITMVLVVSFYLSIQEKGIESFLRIITPEKHEAYVLSLWKRTERKIALWIKGQLFLGLIVGIIFFIGFSIIGIKYALLLSLIAAVFELIPYGLLLAFIPALAIAFSQGSVHLALYTMVLYIVVQSLENYVIAPLVVNKTVGVNSLVVILSLFIGGILIGFWGFILAIPVSVVFVEYLSDLEKK